MVWPYRKTPYGSSAVKLAGTKSRCLVHVSKANLQKRKFKFSSKKGISNFCKFDLLTWAPSVLSSVKSCIFRRFGMLFRFSGKRLAVPADGSTSCACEQSKLAKNEIQVFVKILNFIFVCKFDLLTNTVRVLWSERSCAFRRRAVHLHLSVERLAVPTSSSSACAGEQRKFAKRLSSNFRQETRL